MSWNPFDAAESAEGGFVLPTPELCPVVAVDDEPAVLTLLQRALSKEGYPVAAFSSARDALERIAGGGVALLVSDIKMPDMGGMELIRLALEEDPNLAIVVLTGAADTETAVESLRLGVNDYLEKPISVDALVDSVGRALRRRAQDLYRHKIEGWLRSEVNRRTADVQRRSAQLETVSVSTLSALVRVMEAKDPYLRGHSERVAQISERVARQLGFSADEIETVRIAGLLHDIGIIAVPESILHKQGKLTEAEYNQVKQHVEIGVGILEPLPHIAPAVAFLRCHHERLNGTGYPRGLKGSELPLGGQIVGLAECYVSLTETRAHRNACSPVEAIEVVQGSSDIWFEGRAVDALERVIREDPKLGRLG